MEINPGEEKEFVFVLGYVENPEEEKFVAPKVINKGQANEMIRRFYKEGDVLDVGLTNGSMMVKRTDSKERIDTILGIEKKPSKQ